MATLHVVPAGADQVELQGVDKLLADLGGGGHGGIVVRLERERPAARLFNHLWLRHN
jgi:hypothetical protein